MCWACPFSQERRRCHGGRKRVARSLSFSQVCARCHGGRKAPNECLSGARELAFGKRERVHYIECAFFTDASPLPWREKARCAGLSFSQACALSWWEKSAEGMPFRRREAASGKTGEGVLRRARPFSQVCALSWWEKSAEWMSVQRMETLPEKREKARCAGHVLFHRRATVVIAGERCRRDVYPARRNGFRKSGRKCAALSAPFLQARRRCHDEGKR